MTVWYLGLAVGVVGGNDRPVDVARLDRFSMLAGLPLPEREALAGVMGEDAFDAGHALATSGDFGYALHAIETGAAEVLRADGTVIRTVGPGDTLGEIALLRSGRRSATVRTTEPTRVLTLFARDFLRIRDRVPVFEQAMRDLADARLAG